MYKYTASVGVVLFTFRLLKTKLKLLFSLVSSNIAEKYFSPEKYNTKFLALVSYNKVTYKNLRITSIVINNEEFRFITTEPDEEIPGPWKLILDGNYDITPKPVSIIPSLKNFDSVVYHSIYGQAEEIEDKINVIDNICKKECSSYMPRTDSGDSCRSDFFINS